MLCHARLSKSRIAKRDQLHSFLSSYRGTDTILEFIAVIVKAVINVLRESICSLTL